MKNIVHLFKKFKFGQGRYRKYVDSYGNYIVMDLVKGILYDSKHNTINECPTERIATVQFITEKEFIELFKNNKCKCEFGTGNEIVASSKPFDIVEEFIKRYSAYNIEKTETIHFPYESYTIRYSPEIYVKSSMGPLYDYYRRGCLRCGSCLSDLPVLHEKFEELVAMLDNKITDKTEETLKEICNH